MIELRDKLLGSIEKHKAPIDDYIQSFERFQRHVQQSTKIMQYCFGSYLVIILCFHIYQFAFTSLLLGYFWWTYYLPFLLWMKVVTLYWEQLATKDPHVANEPKQAEMCGLRMDIFNFFLKGFLLIFGSSVLLHVLVGEKGQFLIVIDVFAFVLNIRAVLQANNLKEKLINTIAAFKANRTYFLSDFVYGQMKEPFEEQQVSGQLVAQINLFSSVSGELFNSSFLHPKWPIKSQSEMQQNEQHVLYSH